MAPSWGPGGGGAVGILYLFVLRDFRGGGTVPQEGVIFVKFKLFPKCFFLVCMINLGHLTRVFSIKTFLFQFLCDIEASQFLNSQKIVKKLNFFLTFSY